MLWHFSKPFNRDDSNDWSQYMFSWKNTENYLYIIPVFPSYLEHGLQLISKGCN